MVVKFVATPVRLIFSAKYLWYSECHIEKAFLAGLASVEEGKVHIYWLAKVTVHLSW